ncbi:MAG: PPA1309 family protein [Actinomycetota bacterium]|nr:PPA1309 family protein [Actinomycetota bacterium]
MLTGDALASVVGEIEAHAAESAWDQPARLFALVPTADLARAEPELARVLGLDGASDGLTPIDQELPADVDLELSLTTIMWPDEVVGCAAMVERIVLPPSADGAIPGDRARAASYAAEHPERQELRMVAAATRDGTTQCALRFRSHDEASSVVTGPDLVPALLELLQASLADEPPTEENT